jgi:hypothetical protein
MKEDNTPGDADLVDLAYELNSRRLDHQAASQDEADPTFAILCEDYGREYVQRFRLRFDPLETIQFA